jgi:hypothetical protein
MHDDAPAATTRHSADVTALEQQSGTAARLFDVRAVIGGLFVVYGLLIGGAGVFAGRPELDKAQGVNINLWTGLAMVLLGLLFLVWLKLRPMEHPGRDSATPAP